MPQDGRDELYDVYDVRIFEPDQIRLYRNAGGLLSAVIDGSDVGEVKLARLFPLSRPDQYISVCSADDTELGVLVDLEALDEGSRREIHRELWLRYFVPQVTRILQIKQSPGLWQWEVETDRGPMSLVMRNLHEHLQVISPTRFLITDIDGKRCEIRDVHRLDASSLRQFRKVM